MSILQHLRPRLILLSRAIMWAVIGSLVIVGIFQSSPAWAEPTTCTGNSSIIPHSSIILFLKYAGPPSTYTVELCGTPDPGDEVSFTTTVSQAGLVDVNPTSYTLNDTTPKTISVNVQASHPVANPFTVQIEQTSESTNPGFDGISIQVTAYYSPPVALRDRVIVPVGQSVDIDVLANDVDRLGQGLDLGVNAIVQPPARGTVTVNVSNTIQYQLASGRPGADPFIYRVDDAIGNNDSARVLVIGHPANAKNVKDFDIDPDGGTFLTGDGVEIRTPPLNGVSPDSDVFCVSGQATTTSGDLSAKPYTYSVFTGLAFYLECFVDGEPVTEDILSGPISVLIPLTDEYVAAYGGTDLKVANWDEDMWWTDGISTLPSADNFLSLQTTRLGEFAVFSQGVLWFPFLSVSE